MYFSFQVYDWEKLQARNTERISYLKQQCNSTILNLKTKKRYRHGNERKHLRALMTPDKSILYCRVSKAGSTFIMSKLHEIFHCDLDCLGNSSINTKRLPYKRKQLEVKDAYKFMFVREPYGRLFSTYSNKFYFPKGNWYPIGNDIARRFRKKPSESSLLYGHDVTFAELVRYTVEEYEIGNAMDVHIKPMGTNCSPCHYNFDFIGKLETMTSDLQFLAHEWNSKNITNNINIGSRDGENTFSSMKYFAFTLKKLYGSDINIYNLYQRAWSYYQITGVISKHIKMPFSENLTIKHFAFNHELELARQRSLLNATAVKTQKHEAMLQAYSTVPLRYLKRLRNVVKEDCLLFGYDESPSWLFDRNVSRKISNFDYFIGIN